MGDRSFRRYAIPSRANAILNMVQNEPPPDDTIVNRSSKHIIIIPYHEKRTNRPIKTSPEEMRLVDSLYSRPYEMESKIFDKFCETQITYASHHSANLNEQTIMLKAVFSETSSTEDVCLPSSSQMIDDFSKTDKNIPMNLMCTEELPSDEILNNPEMTPVATRDSPQTSFNNSNPHVEFDYSSDDSVADKNYSPCESSDSEDEIQATTKKRQLKIPRNKKQTIKKTHTQGSPSASALNISVTNRDQYQPSDTMKQKRRHTIDYIAIDQKESALVTSRKRRNTITLQIVPADVPNSEPETSTPQLKRRKYGTSSTERKNAKQRDNRLKHNVKETCGSNCIKQCNSKFDEEERKAINTHYWSLTWREQYLFVRSRLAVAVPKTRKSGEPKRKPKRTFSFKKSNGTAVEVCKIFFLTTLGFKKNNDRVLRSDFLQVNSTAIHDKRGKHQKTLPFDRELLKQHIESFHPTEHHYRREHAPLRRYIPSDVTVAAMHKHFNEQYPDKKVSYELYRKQVKDMNIAFTRLGNEECESCEAYNLHKKETSHDASSQFVADCKVCVEWAKHHERYKKARQLYSAHKEYPKNNSQIYFSADLEKVIMIPRLDSFKAAIFCLRLTAFNQTFAPLGKISNDSKPLAVIWNDSVAGRKQHDIMSAFYQFLLCQRDAANIYIWLDNCSAQNKNWLLYAFLVHMVNSELIATQKICLCYFEPGHTYMSADQVHHQVELAMKRKGKLYDFGDFEEAVASVNNSKVVVKSMQPENFLDLPNIVSERRIQNSNPRAYLKDMAEVCFERGSFDMQYKNNFEDECITLRFLNDKYLKHPENPIITFRTKPKGIDSKRKAEIIEKLSSIIPQHKMSFWKNLPIQDEENSNQTKKRRL